MPEYLEVVEAPRKMRGKGSPRDTLFGVLGHTKADSEMRSLGGLMVSTTKGVSAADSAESASAVRKNTEHHLVGKASKTHIPGKHMGMVPFAGQFMVKVGAETS